MKHHFGFTAWILQEEGSASFLEATIFLPLAMLLCLALLFLGLLFTQKIMDFSALCVNGATLAEEAVMPGLQSMTPVAFYEQRPLYAAFHEKVWSGAEATAVPDTAKFVSGLPLTRQAPTYRVRGFWMRAVFCGQNATARLPSSLTAVGLQSAEMQEQVTHPSVDPAEWIRMVQFAEELLRIKRSPEAAAEQGMHRIRQVMQAAP